MIPFAFTLKKIDYFIFSALSLAVNLKRTLKLLKFTKEICMAVSILVIVYVLKNIFL